ncbi:uncharacterized protein [Coffea arabica]|uniref:Uncharacterized protein LOC113741801 isoform X1 n=1 Tax=Coffea arabica TaxID=13443 RepID=A0A6P6XDD9_COFAR|nr:uncharacterized protein LOC113741801 isoform X1 [Coffea arabica]XP_027125234.1 uncharacterized protein LOC113741801 isoform X1 [Coffea arabica]XP_027125235.1 uncharacterized protein LOC113741801 isoform X1 [Coffea arabica]
MEDSGAILCQISSLKDMLDHVNEEIEKNIQITRDIESEIVKCGEIETALIARELELMRTAYMLQLEIHSLKIVTDDSTSSVKVLENEICCLRMKKNEIKRRMNSKRLFLFVYREQFMVVCLDFQEEISKRENDRALVLLEEKQVLENEIDDLNKKNNALKNSMMAFMEDIVEDLQGSISALQVEIQARNFENDKMLKDIEELKATLLSAISFGS